MLLEMALTAMTKQRFCLLLSRLEKDTQVFNVATYVLGVTFDGIISKALPVYLGRWLHKYQLLLKSLF